MKEYTKTDQCCESVRWTILDTKQLHLTAATGMHVVMSISDSANVTENTVDTNAMWLKGACRGKMGISSCE